MKKSIISTILVLAVVVLMMAACGSTPAKKDDAVVEKSEVVQQKANDKNSAQDKQSESSEKDEQMSEKDLEYLSDLIDNKIAKRIEIFNNEEIIASDPMIDETFKELKSLMEEFSDKIAKLPSIVDVKDNKIRKEYFVFLFEYHSIIIKIENKRLKLQKEIEQVFNDLNDDKNKDVLGELKKILSEWSSKQVENKLEEFHKRIAEKHGIKIEDLEKFLILGKGRGEENLSAKVSESQEKLSPEVRKYIEMAADKAFEALKVQIMDENYIWPIQNKIYSSRETFKGGQDAGFISSGFGDGRSHVGIDLAFKDGVPVYAAASGTISFVGCDSRCNSCDSCDKGYGKYVIISHPNGSETRYAHLQDFKVVQGEKVNQGDLIGHVGHSGLCKGSHLHFEIRKDSKPVDPMLYLPELEEKDETEKTEEVKKPNN